MFRKPFYKAFASDVIKVEFFKSSIFKIGKDYVRYYEFFAPKIEEL